MSRIRFIEPFVWAVESRTQDEHFGTDQNSIVQHIVYLEPRECLKRRVHFTLEGRAVEWWEECIEPYTCTCGAYRFHGHRPCFHVLSVVEYVLRINGTTLKKYLKRIEKSHEIAAPDDPDKLPKRVYRLPPRDSDRGSPKLHGGRAGTGKHRDAKRRASGLVEPVAEMAG